MMLDWKQIETVFLDMDGTLLDLHYDNYFWMQHLPKRFAELTNISASKANERIHEMFVKHQGTLNWYSLDFWSENLEIDIVCLKKEVAGRISYRPNAREFLQSLFRTGLDIALVTNADQKSIELKFANTDLSSHISEVICSHDFGYPKEQPEFWKKLRQNRSYEPATTIFFDDNEDVLSSAEEYGIAHLYSIAKPDSQKASRVSNKFKMLEDFKDILPKP